MCCPAVRRPAGRPRRVRQRRQPRTTCTSRWRSAGGRDLRRTPLRELRRVAATSRYATHSVAELPATPIPFWFRQIRVSKRRAGGCRLPREEPQNRLPTGGWDRPAARLQVTSRATHGISCAVLDAPECTTWPCFSPCPTLLHRTCRQCVAAHLWITHLARTTGCSPHHQKHSRPRGMAVAQSLLAENPRTTWSLHDGGRA